MFATPFQYDPNFPPLCLQTTYAAPDLTQVRRNVKQYLYDSSRDGLKDPNQLLHCGMTVGEAAVFHIRDTNTRRRTVDADPKTMEMITWIRESLQHHFEINFQGDVDDAFRRHVCGSSIFETKHLVKQLRAVLKDFLSDIHFKDKGYTEKLNHVLRDIEKKWNLIHQP